MNIGYMMPYPAQRKSARQVFPILWLHIFIYILIYISEVHESTSHYDLPLTHNHHHDIYYDVYK